jgi:hypothetical protein
VAHHAREVLKHVELLLIFPLEVLLEVCVLGLGVRVGLGLGESLDATVRVGERGGATVPHSA